MELPLYERVVLRRDLPEEGLKKGDVVTTVEFLEARRDLPNAYVVEVFNAVSETIAVLTIPETDLEALRQADQIVVLDEEPVVKALFRSTTNSNSITIDLTEELLKQRGITRDDLKLELALFLFQKDIFSLGKASEFMGLHSTQFQKELAKRQLSIHYDTDEYRRDIDAINRRKNSSSTHYHIQ